MTPFTPTNLLLLFDFNPNSLSGKSIFSLGFHPQHQVRAASHLLLPPSGEAQGTSCLGVCSCPRHNIPDLNLTDKTFKLLPEAYTRGCSQKTLVHLDLGKRAHAHSKPFPVLLYTYPHGSTNKPCPTHSSGTAKKIPSIGAKAHTQALAPSQKSPMLGPLALLLFLRGSPLLHWCCMQPKEKHRQRLPPVLFLAAG